MEVSTITFIGFNLMLTVTAILSCPDFRPDTHTDRNYCQLTTQTDFSGGSNNPRQDLSSVRIVSNPDLITKTDVSGSGRVGCRGVKQGIFFFLFLVIFSVSVVAAAFTHAAVSECAKRSDKSYWSPHVSRMLARLTTRASVIAAPEIPCQCWLTSHRTYFFFLFLRLV